MPRVLNAEVAELGDASVRRLHTFGLGRMEESVSLATVNERSKEILNVGGRRRHRRQRE